jgi:hypothetical protein
LAFTSVVGRIPEFLEDFEGPERGALDVVDISIFWFSSVLRAALG